MCANTFRVIQFIMKITLIIVTAAAAAATTIVLLATIRPITIFFLHFQIQAFFSFFRFVCCFTVCLCKAFINFIFHCCCCYCNDSWCRCHCSITTTTQPLPWCMCILLNVLSSFCFAICNFSCVYTRSVMCQLYVLHCSINYYDFAMHGNARLVETTHTHDMSYTFPSFRPHSAKYWASL